jgi:hypothetical protein
VGVRLQAGKAECERTPFAAETLCRAAFRR